MATQMFHISDILSVATGRLVSDRHMDGIYDILGFMSGSNLFTHQLPRACTEMAPRLLAQHPDLAGVDASGVTPGNHLDWVAEQVARFGEFREVRSEHQFHEIRDPVEELEARVGPERVLRVDLGEGV